MVNCPARFNLNLIQIRFNCLEMDVLYVMNDKHGEHTWTSPLYHTSRPVTKKPFLSNN